MVRSLRRKLACSAILLGLAFLLADPLLPPAHADSDYVGVISIDGTIDSVSERFLSRAIDKATGDRARLAVIELDTPGGLLSSTRDMVETILGAEIPVAVYVSPQGARAASAGTFITAAANFAVMAPGTNIGAASPVASGGQDLPSTLEKKINEDTRAFIRSIADKRGRNSQALEDTVTKALAYTAGEAVEMGVVDFIAADLTDLLAQLDGQTAETAAGTVTVRTKDAPVREIKTNLLERFLSIVANPNIASLLLSIGFLAILIELYSPGFIGPGVVGVISVVLGLVGLGQLPVNWVGVGLILFAMLLLFLEFQQPGLGIFGIGGLVSMVIGLLFLFGNISGEPDIPEPSFRVSLWVVGSVAGVMASIIAFFSYLARATGSGMIEGTIVGQTGIAASDLAPSGRIRIADQEWTATTDADTLIHEGEEVTVVGEYGEILKVAAASQAGGEGRASRIGKRLPSMLGRLIRRGKFRRNPPAG